MAIWWDDLVRIHVVATGALESLLHSEAYDLEKTPSERTGSIHCDNVEYASDDHLVVHLDRGLRLWQPSASRLSGVLRKGEAFAVGPGVIAIANDKAIRMFGLDDQGLRRHGRHEGPIAALAVSPDGKRLLSVDSTRALIWNVETGEPLAVIDPPRGDDDKELLEGGVFAANGEVVTLLKKSEILVYRLSAPGEMRRVPMPDRRGYREPLLSSPDGKLVLHDGVVLDVGAAEAKSLPPDVRYTTGFRPDGSILGRGETGGGLQGLRSSLEADRASRCPPRRDSAGRSLWRTSARLAGFEGRDP